MAVGFNAEPSVRPSSSQSFSLNRSGMEKTVPCSLCMHACVCLCVSISQVETEEKEETINNYLLVDSKIWANV